MKFWLIVVGVGGFLALQNSLWSGDSSIPGMLTLKAQVATQQEEVNQLKDRNQMLLAEVKDLKEQLDAVEERARTDLGMIKKGENFYFVAEADA